MVIILMAVFTFNMLWSVYTTFSKEKIMIEHGEGSLPSSTYSFLVLRHLIRMGLYYVALDVYVESLFGGLGGFKLFLGVLVLALVIELVSAVLETIARLVFFKIVFSKESKE